MKKFANDFTFLEILRAFFLKVSELDRKYDFTDVVKFLANFAPLLKIIARFPDK